MRTWASAVAVVFAAISVTGLAAPGGVAPAPAAMDAPGIDAWRKAHIDSEGWALMHADGAALTYASGGNGVKTDADGFIAVDIRRQHYKRASIGPKSSRSNVQSHPQPK